jgi:hypothetical protein
MPGLRSKITTPDSINTRCSIHPIGFITGSIVKVRSTELPTQVAVIAAIVGKPDETEIERPKHY